MKRTLVLLAVLAGLAQAGSNYDYGVSKQYWQTEQEVYKKCYKFTNDLKKFSKCAKKVSLRVEKRLKKGKK